MSFWNDVLRNDDGVVYYGDRKSITPWLRRATMDLWGLPPSVAERAAFLKDTGADKRLRLVQRLLADRERFSEHWVSFWNDLLHNDEGVTYIGDRKSITPWLLQALRDNMPYHRMVRTLLNPVEKDDPGGFLMGVNWRGDINASQTPVMQAAQNSSQVFLGVNLKCNSCHDSFISSWKLKDAYGLASFFSEGQLELVRCDAKTGEMSAPKFLYPELGGSVPPDAPLKLRLAAVSELFTKPENGRFVRTFVNRVWKKLTGHGLVEPVDDMDAEPFDPDLLDWLSSEFVQKGYDINWLLTEIMTSQAYQLPAVATAEGGGKFVFRGPLYRRVTAEQFIDSISAITGEWRVLGSTKPEPGVYSREWRFKASALTRALGRPVRDLAVTERNNDATTLQLLELVNGGTLAETVRRGALHMLGQSEPAPDSLYDSGVVGQNPAAVDIDISNAKELRLLLVDHDSYDVSRVVAGWADATLEGPGGPVALAKAAIPEGAQAGKLEFKNASASQDAIVAKVPSELVYNIAGKGYTRFRASVGADKNCLSSDINPRIRFYVFSAKPDRARLMHVTGQPPVPPPAVNSNAEELISNIYLQALSRDPSEAERQAAREFLIGKDSSRKVLADGLEDLLWSVFLLPEFQFVN
jgi:hypothetical protein